MSKDEYDGFYILPGDEEEAPGSISLAFFKFKDLENIGIPVETSSMGDKYHVAFFRRDDAGDAVFDEQFEAIFSDPAVYAQGLVGGEIYGCILRKTDKSSKWWNDYLKRAQDSCIMNKLLAKAG